MGTEPKGVTLIHHCESIHDGDLKTCGYQPKLDPVGIWTEGWGHAITDNKGRFIKGKANKALAYKYSKVKSKEDADRLFEEDIKPIFLTIARKITVSLNEDQKWALASHIYNTGGSSTLYSLINSKSPELSNWWTSHYITGQGNPKPLLGLVYRRKSEALLFSTGELKFFN